jgi:cell division protein FtsA
MKKKIAAIDIGTTKICTIMGVIDSESGLRILGTGTASTRGMERFVIQDAQKAKESLDESIHKAEVMAGYKLRSAYLGVTGRQITSMNSKGTVAISRSNMQVRDEDVKRAYEVALSCNLPPEKQILHVIPRSYKIDGQEVKEPVGMDGYELEVDTHIVITPTSSVQNLTKLVNGLGIKTEDLVSNSIASSEAVLAEEEKIAGVLIADIGGDSTDITITKNSRVYHTSTIPAAGQQITADIAIGLGLSYELAEEMKKRYGNLLPVPERENPDRKIGEGEKIISSQELREVLLARVEEIIRLIALDLSGIKVKGLIPAGMVITGGCANIPGIAEAAERLTGLPVRVGIPSELYGVSAQKLKDPAYATGVGLMLWGMKNRGTPHLYNRSVKPGSFWAQLMQKFK